MNKILESLRPAGSAEFSRDESLPPESVVEQARALDLRLMEFARHVLVDDDPAAELPLRQLRVCMALYREPRSMSQLGRELGFSLSAMTQIADRLERASLVIRSFADSDRRVRQLRLTPRARRMLRLREEARIRRIAALLARMPAEARVQALQVLDELGHSAAASNFPGRSTNRNNLSETKPNAL